MQRDYCLSDRIDWDALKTKFACRQRVEIVDFLADEQAKALRADLMARHDWRLVLNAGDKVYEFTRDAFAELDAKQRDDLNRLVLKAGRHGFQYRYEAIRAPDGGDADGLDPLHRFIALLSAPETLERLNYVLGTTTVAFADGQATRYDDGHFLTCHDDDVAGKNRHAAYVYSLAPAWRAEWGGLLMFHGADGNIEEAFVPSMGALRLFAVPQRHSVSYVTPFAREPRLSITGWLRAGEPDQSKL
ncbi:2OG-Fe(II) oxygenase family protein [Sphingopyxis sp.]|uniref:2OG-Fe(II) oxygenase n=1 Tax=Sphingopyxis sp. TaxID=1908224 RepID=UPI0025DC5CBE|nr:2OG-Fe(II) oxygenase family protein [Sphingopyxis sp.]